MNAEMTIASVTPTLAALMGFDPPGACEAGPIPEVVGAAGGRCASKALIFAADAVGRKTFRDRPAELVEVERRLPVRAELASVMPSKTPVCFASMFTGAPPRVHGFEDDRDKFQRRVACDTVFDAASRGGLRPAIAAIPLCSMSRIFLGSEVAIHIEETDALVCEAAARMIAEDGADLIVAYYSGYDHAIHKSGPDSHEAVDELRRLAAAFAHLSAVCEQAWAGSDYVMAFCPDHGCHVDPLSKKGSHGLDVPEDMELDHRFAFMRA